MSASDTIKSCSELVSIWSPRNAAFRDWYELVLMVDKLKEEKMESFVSNEPRSFYNLALHLLTASTIAPRIPLEESTPEEISDINAIESFLRYVWREKERLSLSRGRGGFLRELASFLLLTGWYSVFSLATDNEIIAEVWNPAEVYPEFSEEGLLRCAHVYALTGRAANRKALVKGWKLTSAYPASASTKLYDYWTVENGVVQNSIVLGNSEVKPLMNEPGLDKIPIYCSPIAGLPDRGTIIAGTEWKKNIGQSILASNTNIYTYTNKLMSFLMQLIRDTAQARWVEKGSGEPKVKPEDIFKRGAVFHLGMGEDLAPVPMPPIPIELRAALMDVSAMRQKGALPDVLFGGVNGQISGYLMQQISGAAAHILKPYQEALKFLLEELCNDWIEDIRQYGFAPYDKKIPKADLPRVEIDLRLNIPGDVVQRATVARMLDPSFSISTQTVTDMLFPEIENPLAEQARVQRDRAMQHPIMSSLHLIEALRQRASMLAEAGDTETAALYSRAADTLIGTIQPQPAEAGAPTPRPEVQPLQARTIPEEFR